MVELSKEELAKRYDKNDFGKKTEKIFSIATKILAAVVGTEFVLSILTNDKKWVSFTKVFVPEFIIYVVSVFTFFGGYAFYRVLKQTGGIKNYFLIRKSLKNARIIREYLHTEICSDKFLNEIKRLEAFAAAESYELFFLYVNEAGCYAQRCQFKEADDVIKKMKLIAEKYRDNKVFRNDMAVAAFTYAMNINSADLFLETVNKYPEFIEKLSLTSVTGYLDVISAYEYFTGNYELAAEYAEEYVKYINKKFSAGKYSNPMKPANVDYYNIASFYLLEAECFFKLGMTDEACKKASDAERFINYLTCPVPPVLEAQRSELRAALDRNETRQQYIK